MSDDKQEPTDPNDKTAIKSISGKTTNEKESSLGATESQTDSTDSRPPPATSGGIDPVRESQNSDPNLFNAKPAPRMSVPDRSSKSIRAGNRKLQIVTIMVAIMALVAVGWASYNQYLMQQDWQQLESNINQTISTQSQLNENSLKKADTSLQAANTNQNIIQQQTQLIGQLRDSLTATQQRIKELSGRRNQDWLLAEAEYLIKLAEYKISLEKDKQTSIALLKTADEKIATIGDNSLLDLRQSLAKDIADLQLIVAPDITGIAVQLNAVVEQIPHLNIIALEFTPKVTTAEIEGEDDDSFSWEKLYRDFLDDFVTTKDHSQPVKPLMTMEQRGNLNANIQLALQQAQIALVRGKQSLYELHLDKAIEWIDLFFKKEQPTESVTENLTLLRQMQINIDLPSQLSAKKAIELINQQRLYQWLEQTDETQAFPSLETQP